MIPGTASKTSVMVCTARAAAHAKHLSEKFSDPTAFSFLSPETQKRVEVYQAGKVPQEFKEQFRFRYLHRLACMMVVRTATIDAAIIEADLPQLVILGAGLDGRAWRMPELKNTLVFEVDHPDTQRDKRQRLQGLKQLAREVRFVSVDFTKDNLDRMLAAAGHDATKPTMWIWEGVVMYLTPAEVEATLKIITKRSASGSRVNILYHTWALMLWLLGFTVKRMGEPLRSTFTPMGMSILLGANGFKVIRDEQISDLGKDFSSEIAKMTRPMSHSHIVTARKD